MEGKGKYGRRLAIVRTSHHIALFLASGSLGQWVRRSSQSPFRLLTTQQQRSLYLRSFVLRLMNGPFVLISRSNLAEEPKLNNQLRFMPIY